MNFASWKQGILEYVSKREKGSGGFGSTPYLPPTLEDTYFALMTLRLLHQKINFDKHRAFLFRQKLSELGFEPVAKFLELLKIFHLLPSPDPGDKVFLRAKEKLAKSEVSFKELYCLFEIFLFFKKAEFLEEIKTRVFENLSKKKMVTLEDYYHAYRVLGRVFPEELLSHILEAQNPDGGFGFYKGTTSYVENCFFACFVLKGFSLAPKYLDKLKEFVWACRNRDGGFGRSPQGISFLESTYYACWILLNF